MKINTHFQNAIQIKLIVLSQLLDDNCVCVSVCVRVEMIQHAQNETSFCSQMLLWTVGLEPLMGSCYPVLKSQSHIK